MTERILTRKDIEEILPHRRPFLFLQSVLILEPGKRAVGSFADLTQPEFQQFLKGHFPGLPIFPGALITESLAELAGVAVASSGRDDLKGKIGVLTGNDMKYRQPIIPAEAYLVSLEVEIVTLKSRGGKAKVSARQEGKVVAEGGIEFVMKDRLAFSQQLLSPQPGN